MYCHGGGGVDNTRAMWSIDRWYKGADILIFDSLTIIGHMKRAPEMISILCPR